MKQSNRPVPIWVFSYNNLAELFPFLIKVCSAHPTFSIYYLLFLREMCVILDRLVDRYYGRCVVKLGM